MDQAESCERTGSQLYAGLCRRLAREPLVREVVLDDRWDVPIRLLGGLHHLVLDGRLAGWDWDGVREALHRERAWLARFVAEQGVQTNEVQRCWALLPAFLSLGDERPLELVELGASAGLNLVWDRYRYAYAAGSWGSGALTLTGEERAAVPAPLLDAAPAIVRRRGIDLRPLDVADDEDVRLLECFVWADSEERMARLRQALAIAADDPPEIVAGDYVELLPSLLADRDPDATTVVFQTVSTIYLEDERYAELRRIVDEADPPVAWISTRRWSEEETGLVGGFELEARRAGDRAARLVARMGFHGQWLEWSGELK
ncbi:MAG: DUF2332 domain-containing protein [Gaiellaceae bacterium]